MLGTLNFAQPEWLALIAVAAAGVLLSLRRVHRSQPRQVIAGILRVLTLAALAIALAAPLGGSHSRHTDMVFALDYSRSLAPEAIDEALAFVNRAISGKQSQSRIGLVVFGADAAVEYTVGRGHEPVREIAAHVERGSTNIGRAIEVPSALFRRGRTGGSYCSPMAVRTREMRARPPRRHAPWAWKFMPCRSGRRRPQRKSTCRA